jgi:hypothetical protein
MPNAVRSLSVGDDRRHGPARPSLVISMYPSKRYGGGGGGGGIFTKQWNLHQAVGSVSHDTDLQGYNSEQAFTHPDADAMQFASLIFVHDDAPANCGTVDHSSQRGPLSKAPPHPAGIAAKSPGAGVHSNATQSYGA